MASSARYRLYIILYYNIILYWYHDILPSSIIDEYHILSVRYQEGYSANHVPFSDTQRSNSVGDIQIYSSIYHVARNSKSHILAGESHMKWLMSPHFSSLDSHGWWLCGFREAWISNSQVAEDELAVKRPGVGWNCCGNEWENLWGYGDVHRDIVPTIWDLGHYTGISWDILWQLKSLPWKTTNENNKHCHLP